jgi:hypothetical protein
LLADDGNHRLVIHFGVVQTVEQVNGARSGSGKAYSGSPLNLACAHAMLHLTFAESRPDSSEEDDNCAAITCAAGRANKNAAQSAPSGTIVSCFDRLNSFMATGNESHQTQASQHHGVGVGFRHGGGQIAQVNGVRQAIAAGEYARRADVNAGNACGATVVQEAVVGRLLEADDEQAFCATEKFSDISVPSSRNRPLPLRPTSYRSGAL